MGAEQSTPMSSRQPAPPPRPDTVASCPQALKELLEHLFELRFDQASACIRRDPSVCAKRCYDGRLPLHMAVAGLQPPSRLIVQIIEAFPEAVADQENTWQISPLHHAATYGFRSLCGHEVDWDNWEESDAHEMDLSALTKMLEVLPGAPALRNHAGVTPLLGAMTADHFPVGSGRMVRAMLRSCPEAAGVADHGGVVPLMRAVGLHTDDEDLEYAKELLRLAPESLHASTTGNWNVLTFALRNSKRRVMEMGGFSMYVAGCRYPNIDSALWVLGRNPTLAQRTVLETPKPPLHLREGVRTRKQQRELRAWQSRTMLMTPFLGPVGAQLDVELMYFSPFDMNPVTAGRLVAFSIALNAAAVLEEQTEGPGTASWASKLKELRRKLNIWADGRYMLEKAVIGRCVDAASRYAAARHKGRARMLALLCSLKRAEGHNEQLQKQEQEQQNQEEDQGNIPVSTGDEPASAAASVSRGRSKRSRAKGQPLLPQMKLSRLHLTRSRKRKLQKDEEEEEEEEPSMLVRSLASLDDNLQPALLKAIQRQVVPRWQDFFEELLKTTVFQDDETDAEGKSRLSRYYSDTWPCENDAAGSQDEQPQQEPMA